MNQLVPEVIWLIDDDPVARVHYQTTIGLQYRLRFFETVAEFFATFLKVDEKSPRLVIADPECTQGSFMDEFQSFKAARSKGLTLPEFIIVSRVDQLELMRFYLKAGARDYVFKPIRPNELIAKVERAIYQISNREVLILRSDLDGINIPELTFREHQLLTVFINSGTRCVSRSELYEAIWSKTTVNRKTLDVHLFNLRRKLRPLGYEILFTGSDFSLVTRPVTEPT